MPRASHTEEQLSLELAQSTQFQDMFKFTLLSESAMRDDIIPTSDEPHEVVSQTLRAIADEKFDIARNMVAWSYDERIRHSDGSLVYPDSSQALIAPFYADDIDMDDINTFLAVYMAWFEQNPDCPYAAGSLILALGHTAFAHRGTGWAQDMTLRQQFMFYRYNSKATKHRKKYHQKFRNHWYWKYCLHRFSIIECPRYSQVKRRFLECIQDDPENYDFYSIQSHAMLERWFGEEWDMAEVASLYMENTKEQKSYRGYAEILDYGFCMDGPDFYEFHDETMLKAVKEQLDDHWCQFTLTRYASCLFFMGRYQDFLDIMKGRLKQLHPQAWISVYHPYHACALAVSRLENGNTAKAA